MKPDSRIPYDMPFSKLAQYDKVADTLSDLLPRFWIAEYKKSCRGISDIGTIRASGFSFIFDNYGDVSKKFVFGKTKEERVVAAYGRSGKNQVARDSNRMKYFIAGFKGIPPYADCDKGHYIAHLAGGGLDINLFPQRTDLNRGWSDEGKRFREMERYASTNPGVFFFARPIYADLSWRPAALEYGVLRRDNKLDVAMFNNRP